MRDTAFQSFNVAARHVNVAQTERQARARPQNPQARKNPAVGLPKRHVHSASQALLIKEFRRVRRRIFFFSQCFLKSRPSERNEKF